MAKNRRACLEEKDYNLHDLVEGWGCKERVIRPNNTNKRKCMWKHTIEREKNPLD